jgi:hypothetical protein
MKLLTGQYIAWFHKKTVCCVVDITIWKQT